MIVNDYIIFTNSACDIKPKLLKQWGCTLMRQGAQLKITAINADAFMSDLSQPR